MESTLPVTDTSTDTPSPEAERLVTTANVTPKITNSNSLLPNTASNDIQQHVNSANSGDVDIRNLTVTLIRTVVLQRSWYQMTGCSVQWKMNKNTHGYMTVWYTKDISVSFVNCFVVILPHHNMLLLLALTLVRTVWLLFYYWTSKLINVFLFPTFPNSHH